VLLVFAQALVGSLGRQYDILGLCGRQGRRLFFPQFLGRFGCGRGELSHLSLKINLDARGFEMPDISNSPNKSLCGRLDLPSQKNDAASRHGRPGPSLRHLNDEIRPGHAHSLVSGLFQSWVV
jgi:hypothetical protein